jgi:uncharacterized membrane protein YphA (DoxX/SURF4 family)
MNSTSYWLKYIEVICLFLVVIGLSQSLPNASEWQFMVVSKEQNIVLFLALLLGLSGIISYAWHKSDVGSHWHSYFHDVIAFYTAYEVMRYGASKLLKTQLQPPNFVLETPFGDLSGFWLTWAYHGYSPTFAFLLGLIQVGGSILLLFRKTRLIGVFVLLPVLVNINLINQFYSISPLAYFNSLHYTFILVFLMLLDYDKLKQAFLSYSDNVILNQRMILINIARVGVVIAAFWTIQNLKDSFQPKTPLNGVWQVMNQNKNETTTSTNLKQDSLWTKIYFEWRYGCIFKHHPDKFQEQDLRGNYEVDEGKKVLKINFYAPEKDSMLLSYGFQSDSLLSLRGVYQSDSLQLSLKRLK